MEVQGVNFLLHNVILTKEISKVKVELSLGKYHTMEMYCVLNRASHHDVWVSRGIAPCILNLGTRWR
jgi:hypothetical protein